VVQWQVLYLGEINDSQRSEWSKAIEVFDETAGQSKQIALFPEDRRAPALACDVVSIRLSAMRLRRPRQWGACWMSALLWEQLRLDEFWSAARPPSREGTSWLNILKTLVSYQLISPGSQWRLHRHWFERSATGARGVERLGDRIGRRDAVSSQSLDSRAQRSGLLVSPRLLGCRTFALGKPAHVRCAVRVPELSAGFGSLVSRSCCATNAMIPTVRLSMSQATNLTSALLQAEQEVCVAAQPVELGDQKLRSGNLRVVHRSFKLGTVVLPLAALDFGVGLEQPSIGAAAGDKLSDGRLLRFKT
jgi:hypothetical protein